MRLQVDYLNKGEFFGDVAVTKTPIAQTTIVASGVTTILLVISKCDAFPCHACHHCWHPTITKHAVYCLYCMLCNLVTC